MLCCPRHIVRGFCLIVRKDTQKTGREDGPMRARWFTVTASSWPLSERASF